MQPSLYSTPIALFDLDGSLADFDGAMIRDLNLVASPGEPPITDLRKLEKMDHIHHRMDIIKSYPGWWLNLEPLSLGFLALKLVREAGFDVHILTKGPSDHPHAWGEKVTWCRQNPILRDLPIHVVSDKSLVYGQLLYDDYAPYMEKWLGVRPRGLGIMPNKAIDNKNVFEWDGSAYSIARLKSILKICFCRKPGEELVIQ